jgi:hypothetical protein
VCVRCCLLSAPLLPPPPLLQVRRVRLVSCAPPAVPPSHLYEGCTALRCEVATASGARLVVVLGGPPGVLGDRDLVEHALRQTLVSGGP